MRTTATIAPPGSEIATWQKTIRSARPAAPSIHVQLSRPQSRKSARPASSEAAQIRIAAMKMPIIGGRSG